MSQKIVRHPLQCEPRPPFGPDAPAGAVAPPTVIALLEHLCLPDAAGDSGPSPAELRSVQELMSSVRLLGSGMDLAFIVFALQIQQMDRQVADAIVQIRVAGELREAISDRIGELRRARAAIEEKGGGEQHVHLASAEIDGISLKKIDFFVAGREAEVSAREDGEIGSWKKRLEGFTPTRKLEVSVADLDAEIKRLEGEAQQLDSDREIKMIMLNQQLNKKEQAVTQLSSIIKKSHDTRSAVIGNLR